MEPQKGGLPNYYAYAALAGRNALKLKKRVEELEAANKMVAEDRDAWRHNLEAWRNRSADIERRNLELVKRNGELMGEVSALRAELCKRGEPEFLEAKRVQELESKLDLMTRDRNYWRDLTQTSNGTIRELKDQIAKAGDANKQAVVDHYYQACLEAKKGVEAAMCILQDIE
jgi:chromosome segregation ATPase